MDKKINIPPETLESMKRFFAETSLPRLIAKEETEGKVEEGQAQ